MMVGYGLVGMSQTLTDGLEYKAEMQATLSSGDHTPLWLNANKYGLSSLKTANGYFRGAIERPLATDSARKWAVGYGLDAAVATGFTSTLVIQQAYAEARWLKAVVTLGAKEQPMELKNQELSSGSQTLGVNARPVPQLRLALPDYWSVPGLNGWLAVKGHVAYGVTTDDRWQKRFTGQNSRYTEHTWYHSKAAYLRFGPKNITFEFGMEGACQFGGSSFQVIGGAIVETKNHTDLSAFWHALIPSGKEVTEVNFPNKEGNHVGSWVARLNFDYPSWNLGVYADQFFEDNSSLLHISQNGWGKGDEVYTMKESRYFIYDFKDWMLGAELKLKHLSWLNTIVMEYLYTKYQGGPVYHDHTPKVNEHICGRDQFYNHYLYTGWQHWGMVMGNPLYRSPLYNDDGQIRVQNNRFVAWHFGVSGNPVTGLHYRLLATFQTGYGTYDNLFPDPEHNVSLLAEVDYRFPAESALRGWSLRGALGLDSGPILGDNTGMQLTIAKQGLFKRKQKR